ncbi:hypothetical protein SNEBB_007871 [Seison nebaliae]|nr:hypothetical protein SNEBB_007871 [Seison nebaliae]
MKEEKIKEAKEHIHLAKKSLKTSIFNKKCDYSTASEEYFKAAVCYRLIADNDSAIEYYSKAAEMSKVQGKFFEAARHLENANQIANTGENWQLVYELTEKIYELYREDKKTDSALITLKGNAKALERKLPKEAMILFKRQSELLESLRRYREASAIQLHISELEIRNRNITKGKESLRKCLELYENVENVHEGEIGIIIIVLLTIYIEEDDIAMIMRMKDCFEKYPKLNEFSDSHIIVWIIDGMRNNNKKKMFRINWSSMNLMI